MKPNRARILVLGVLLLSFATVFLPYSSSYMERKGVIVNTIMHGVIPLVLVWSSIYAIFCWPGILCFRPIYREGARKILIVYLLINAVSGAAVFTYILTCSDLADVLCAILGDRISENPLRVLRSYTFIINTVVQNPLGVLTCVFFPIVNESEAGSFAVSRFKDVQFIIEQIISLILMGSLGAFLYGVVLRSKNRGDG